MFLKKSKAWLIVLCLVVLVTFLAVGLAQAAVPYNYYKAPSTNYNYLKYPYYYYPQQPTPTQPAPTQPAPTQPTTTTQSTTILAAEEQQMLNLVNQERSSRGLKPLSLDSRLTSVARAYSQEMVKNNFFSHTSAVDGSSPFDRIKRAGITYKYAGENLAYNSSVSAAHTALMNSDGHRRNILNPNFTHIGIGIVKKGTSQIMVTQAFIGI